MKGSLALVAFVLFLISLFFYQMHSGRAKWNDLTENGKEVVGVVANIHKGFKTSYSIKGLNYTNAGGSRPRGLFDGERYRVLYDETDPSRSITDFYTPVFDTTAYIKLKSNGFSQVSGSSKGLIKFKYEYANKEWTRYHKFDFRKCSPPYVIWVNPRSPKQAYFSCL